MRWIAAIAALAVVAACAEERDGAPTTTGQVDVPAVALPSPHPIRSVGDQRVGGMLLAARIAAREVLLVADVDARWLRVVDPATHEELSHHVLPGEPSSLVIGGDGRLYTSLRDTSEVLALAPAVADRFELEQVASIRVATEPVALALTPDGGQLLVASAWSHKLAAFALADRRRLFEVDTPREPRAVAVTPNGRVAWVTHAAGTQITRVDLPEGVEGEARTTAVALAADGRTTGQGFAIANVGEDVLSPGVLGEPGPDAVGTYGHGNGHVTHQPMMVHVQPNGLTVRLARPSARTLEAPITRGSCNLPRAATAAGDTLYVTCFGTNHVIAYDASQPSGLEASRRGVMRVPDGPSGVAVGADERWLHVWSQFTRTVSSIRLADLEGTTESGVVQPERMTQLERGPRPLLSREARIGRSLFHATGDRRISSSGRACASCHPDGRDDMMTWPTPNGLRQTPMLAGRLGEATGPYGWEGASATIAEHLEQTIARLGGRGLPEADVAALIAYLEQMPAPPVSNGEVADAQVERGKALFFAETVGCASCHQNATDSDGAVHDVGSGFELETPSLRFVAGTAPYYHDGRYPTLRALLEDSQGKMGWAHNLAGEDVEALASYLRTL